MNEVLKEEVSCNATATQIWNALTVVNLMKEWYFEMFDYTPELGNIFYFFEPGENKKFKHVCEILEFLPNEKFSHTWSYPSLTKGSSVVTWNLNEVNGVTTVTLTHEGLSSFADGGSDFEEANFKAGWNEILHKSLKQFVEKK
jgi:uncharacterized protein YndB with AHSA1/START domain